MTKRIALDVGGTTGVAVHIGDTYRTCTATSPEELWQLLAGTDWDVVVYEQFSTAGRISKYGLYTVELVGGVKALCWQTRTPCVGHIPAQRRPYLDTAAAKLRRLGQQYCEHELDAMAHLLSWEARH